MGSQPPTVLPVRFTKFDALRSTGSILLNWAIATDEAISHFEVERSFDGRNFQLLEVVNKHSSDAYSTSDASAAVRWKTVFYRIKLVKAAGGHAYSTIIRLPLNGEQELVVAPNPVNDVLQLSGKTNVEGIMNLHLFDAQGRQVLHQQWKQTPGAFVRSIELVHLQPGFYVLKVSGGEGIKEFKLVKEK